MLTLPTRVLEPGTFRYSLDKFIGKLRNPLRFKRLNNMNTRIKETTEKNEVYITLDFPTDRKPDQPAPADPVLDYHAMPEILYDYSKDEKYPDLYFIKNDEKYYLRDGKREYHAFVVEMDSYSLDYMIYVPDYGWFSVGRFFDNNKSKSGKRYVQIILDEKLKKKTDRKKNRLWFYQRAISSVYTFLHTIDSTYLCIRYPFLYPRNRFNDKHYNNHRLQRYTDKLDSESVMKSVSVRWETDPRKMPHLKDTDKLPDILFKEETEEKNNMKDTYEIYYILHNGEEYEVARRRKNLHNTFKTPINYRPVKLGLDYYLYNPIVKKWIKIDDIKNFTTYKFENKNKEENGYEVRHFDIVFNKPLKVWGDFMKWIHDYFLQWVHIIPTFSEIDAMDTGWFRAFGMDMIKEVNAQLKTDKYRKEFRITQIKEKFGGLRFYISRGSEALYDIINKYEGISYKICIVCGKPARYITRGWICPYCENCVEHPECCRDLQAEPDKDDECEF